MEDCSGGALSVSELLKAGTRLGGRESKPEGAPQCSSLSSQTEEKDSGPTRLVFARRTNWSFGSDGLASDMSVISNSRENVAVLLFPALSRES
jgi:hypothetical protein